METKISYAATYQNGIGKLLTEKNCPRKIAPRKSVPLKKFPEKYILLRFDLNGNAYSAGDNFHFSIDLIQNQKHVNKNGVWPTWGIAYEDVLKNTKKN